MARIFWKSCEPFRSPNRGRRTPSHEPAFTRSGTPGNPTQDPSRPPATDLRMGEEEAESACKPGSVRLAARQSFLSAWRRRQAPATYPGTTRAALSFPYLVLLRVGFAMPRGVSPARGALLPHRFTLTTRIRRCRSAVCSLLHFPSARAAQALPGTLPCGARTFLDALARIATARPTPPPDCNRDAVTGATSGCFSRRLHKEHAARRP